MSLNTISWVVKSVAPAGKDTTELLPFQFGIVDTKTYKTIGSDGKAGHKKVAFYLGSPNQQRPEGEQDNPTKFNNIWDNRRSFRSGDLEGKNISGVTLHLPTTEHKPNVYYYGYNGLHDCQGLSMKCDTIYDFNVRVKGRPVRNYFSGLDTNIENVRITTGCCDDCTTTCPADNTNVAHKYIDEVITKLNALEHARKFGKFSKVEKCTPARPVPTKTTFNTFCITLCNNGDENDLAALQSAYPTLKVSQKERQAPMTTYEVTQIGTAPAPTSYVQVAGTVLANCAVCPAGYTLVTGGVQLLLEVDDDGTANTAPLALTAVQAVIPTATAAMQLSYATGVSKYLVTVPLVWVAPTTPLVDARIIQVLRRTEDHCTSVATVTTVWTACGSYYKITRDLCMAVPNPDCTATGTLLEKVQAFYVNDPEVVVNSITQEQALDCVSEFKVSQWSSNYMEDGCDTYGYDGAKFNDLQPFGDSFWGVCPCEGWTVNVAGCPVPPLPTERCCSIGIKWEGFLFGNDEFDECFDDAFAVRNYGAVELEFSMYVDDRFNGKCVPAVLPTWMQASSYVEPSLTGAEVFKDVIKYRLQKGEMWANPSNEIYRNLMKAEGYRYGVDSNAQYKLIKVRWETKGEGTDSGYSFHQAQDINLYVLANDLVTFEALKQQVIAYAASEGGCCSADVEFAC